MLRQEYVGAIRSGNAAMSHEFLSRMKAVDDELRTRQGALDLEAADPGPED